MDLFYKNATRRTILGYAKNRGFAPAGKSSSKRKKAPAIRRLCTWSKNYEWFAENYK